MTHLSQQDRQHPKRILSKSYLSPELITQRRTVREELATRSRPLFEKLRQELIKNYYNWFIAIDLESEHYIVAPNLEELVQKIGNEYPQQQRQKLTIYCLNETGNCGRV